MFVAAPPATERQFDGGRRESGSRSARRPTGPAPFSGQATLGRSCALVAVASLEGVVEWDPALDAGLENLPEPAGQPDPSPGAPDVDEPDAGGAALGALDVFDKIAQREIGQIACQIEADRSPVNNSGSSSSLADSRERLSGALRPPRNGRTRLCRALGRGAAATEWNRARPGVRLCGVDRPCVLRGRPQIETWSVLRVFASPVCYNRTHADHTSPAEVPVFHRGAGAAARVGRARWPRPSPVSRWRMNSRSTW